MCGIVGIIYKDFDKRVDESELVKMRDLQFHRGPDDYGCFIDHNAGIAHRRLSIIDLSSGSQPMTNEDESLWIVFNGEIYNYKELRAQLIKNGHIFRTHSDTEVILHLYEEKRGRCPEELNGIFAFAIWDKTNKSLFMARDHMGVKPLYYAETDKAFIFSSEIKSIIATDHLNGGLNESTIGEYFLFRQVSGEDTLYKGVKSLPPASSLCLDRGKVKTQSYWSLYPTVERQHRSFGDTLDELSTLVQDAIKMQMISDVPLGTFCSGGIDSSLVSAIAAQNTAGPINTFSVGFYEDGYDETRYAQIVSAKYGTNHHELKLSNKEFARLLPEMIWYNDEPLNFPNSVQIYAISKLAKEHVTVVLTGEGADELFGGYPRYHIPGIARYFRKFPSPLLKLLKNFFDITPLSHYYNKAYNLVNQSEYDAVLLNSGFLDRDSLKLILPNTQEPDLLFRHSNITKTQDLNGDLTGRLSLLDQQNYLISILNRQDKMSMAASIESRVPFLDFRIVEFANKIPPAYKTKLFRTKHILKKVALDHLPKEIVYRKKSGFGVPLAKWFREPEGMGGLVKDLCADIKKEDFVDKAYFEKLVSEHSLGLSDHSDLLWTCVNFLIWKKKTFVKYATPSEI